MRVKEQPGVCKSEGDEYKNDEGDHPPGAGTLRAEQLLQGGRWRGIWLGFRGGRIVGVSRRLGDDGFEPRNILSDGDCDSEGVRCAFCGVVLGQAAAQAVGLNAND